MSRKTLRMYSGTSVEKKRFSKSNGITIKVVDKSHHSAVEVISRHPDWAERNENLLEEIKTWFSLGSYRKDSEKPYYVA